MKVHESGFLLIVLHDARIMPFAPLRSLLFLSRLRVPDDVLEKTRSNLDLAVSARCQERLAKAYWEICDAVRMAVPPEQVTNSAWARGVLAARYEEAKLTEEEGWP